MESSVHHYVKYYAVVLVVAHALTGYGECFKNLSCWRGGCWLLGSAINPLDDTPNQPTTATATTTHHRAAAATAGAAAAAAATWLTHDIPLPTKPEPPWLMH